MCPKKFLFSFLNSWCPHTKTTPLLWDFLRLVCLCFRLSSIFPEIPICFYLFIYSCGFCAAWWFIICGNWDCFILRFVSVFHFHCHSFWCQFTIILQAPINEWKLQWEINPPCSKPTPQLQCYYIFCSLGHATLWHSLQYPLQFYAMFRIAYKILHWSLSLYQFLN